MSSCDVRQVSLRRADVRSVQSEPVNVVLHSSLSVVLVFREDSSPCTAVVLGPQAV